MDIKEEIKYCIQRGENAIKKAIQNKKDSGFYFGLDKCEKTGVVLSNIIQNTKFNTINDSIIERFPAIKRIVSLNNIEVCISPIFMANNKIYTVKTQWFNLDDLYKVENSPHTYVIYNISIGVIPFNKNKFCLRYSVLK